MTIMNTNRTIYLNEDNHHFYGGHPPEDMTPEGIDALVDYYAQGTQMAGILFCVNVQRALFDSAVWEKFWDDYDPALGDDQPCIKREHGVKNHLLLRERGLDQFTRWLARCRHHGIEGWLTMRMNDAHGLKETDLHARGERDVDDWHIHWPPKYWREHPELRRAPYRLERSWEGAFDYGLAEVREHHLALIREVFSRYDMFGFEMDWLRWGMYFAPGHEQAGMPILTQFVRDVRAIADEAERRVGHPIKLAHRLPANPEAAMALGFDPITWSKEGMVDMVTIGTFGGAIDFNPPVAIWRRLLGDNVKLIAQTDATAQPSPPRSIYEYEFMYGGAATALQRGVDGVYLFNQNYRGSDEPALLSHMLRNLGRIETLKTCRRRHAVTYPATNAPGGPVGNVLPIPLRQPKIGTDFGRMEDNITLRISIGPKPETGQAVLCLGFGGGVPAGAVDNLELRLNTVPISPCAEPQYDGISTRWALPGHGWHNGAFEAVRFFAFPATLLFDDVNVIEFVAPLVDGSLEWAEILIPGAEDVW